MVLSYLVKCSLLDYDNHVRQRDTESAPPAIQGYLKTMTTITPGRYQVRIIESDNDASANGAVLFTSDDATEAKRDADRLGGAHYYGVVIVDTVEHTADWGDRVTSLTQNACAEVR